jgi:hypothetical protein
MMATHGIIGLIGVAFYQIAYFAVQVAQVDQNDYRIVVLNVLGPIACGYSLLHDYNLHSLTAHIIWLLIALAGIVKACRRNP